jgi:hypothetical protein
VFGAERAETGSAARPGAPLQGGLTDGSSDARTFVPACGQRRRPEGAGVIHRLSGRGPIATAAAISPPRSHLLKQVRPLNDPFEIPKPLEP